MRKMSNKKSLSNNVKKAGTKGEGFSFGMCPVGKQHRPSRHPATARRK